MKLSGAQFILGAFRFRPGLQPGALFYALLIFAAVILAGVPVTPVFATADANAAESASLLRPLPLPSFRQEQALKPPRGQKVSPPSPRSVLVTGTRIGNTGLRIRFHWLSPVKSAFFKRSDRLFVAFDRPATFDPHGLEGQTAFFSTAQALEAQAGSAFLLNLTEGVEVTFQEELPSRDWIVTLTLKSSEGLTPSETKASAAMNATGPPPALPPVQQASLTSVAPDAAPSPASSEPGDAHYTIADGKVLVSTSPDEVPIFLEDPLTGEDLTIVPLAQATPTQRSFQEFTLLPTLKGLVFLSKSDALTFSKPPEAATLGLVLKSTGGALALSERGDLSLERTKAQPPQLIKPEKWRTLPTHLKEMRNLEQQLLRETVTNPKKAQINRLKRAFLLLAMNHSYEAAGILKLIQDKNPALQDNPRLNLLQGVAHVLSHQPVEALRYLHHPSLKDEADATLWAGLAEIERENYYAGLQKIIPHLKRLGNYPPRMRQLPAFLMAEAAVKTNYPGKIFLDGLNKDYMTRRELDKFDLLTAQMEKSPQNQDHAERLLNKVLSGQNMQAKVEAELALLNAKQEPTTTAIDRLEGYRYRWRGDQTELALLGRLATLYQQEKEPEKALFLYQIIKDYFPNSERGRLEIGRAAALFYQTFTKNTDRPPFHQVALYDRYQDLAPEDARRFDILEKLAETYERLDLLPHAARELEALLRAEDPKGDRLGKILLQLATLYKRDRQQAKLVGTLGRLGEVAIDDPVLFKERLFFQARYQEEQGNLEKALTLLQNEDSYEGLHFKARLAWKGANWGLASEILTRLVAHAQTPSTEREEFLISLAVALHKQGDADGVFKLRQSFLPLFQTPKNKQTFLLLTSQKPEISENPTRKELLAQLAAIENFEKSLPDPGVPNPKAS